VRPAGLFEAVTVNSKQEFPHMLSAAPSSAPPATGRRARVALVAVCAAALSGLSFAASASAQSSQAPVALGAASSYAVLAGSAVQNTGPSVVSGDVGTSPGSFITGFPPGIVVNGVFHAADSAAAAAQNDLTTTYNDVAGRSPVTAVGPELGGLTLAPVSTAAERSRSRAR
jgi:hypothetical protein